MGSYGCCLWGSRQGREVREVAQESIQGKVGGGRVEEKD